MPYILSNLALPALTKTTSITNELATGTVVSLSDGGEAMWVKANSAISTNNAVVIAVDHTVNNLTTARATAASGVGIGIGFAQTSIASAWYGWVQLSGRPVVKLAANCADRVPLFTTATEGVLDDATVSGAMVLGVVSKTTISNATAITCMVSDRAHIYLYQNPA